MPIIRNTLNSRILIHTKDSKYIDLLEKSTTEVTDDDLLSSHLQSLIQKGFAIMEKEVKEEVKDKGKVKVLSKGTDVKIKAGVDSSTGTAVKKDTADDQSTGTRDKIKAGVDPSKGTGDKIDTADGQSDDTGVKSHDDQSTGTGDKPDDDPS